MSFSCKLLFISITSLSLMELNFLNQYLWMPYSFSNLVLFWVFIFWVFIFLVFIFLVFIFAFGSFSNPSKSFAFRFFCYVKILYTKSVLFPCHAVVGLSSCILPLLPSNFSLVFSVLFSLYCFIQPRYILSLPSFISTFLFIFLSCIFCFSCFLCSCQKFGVLPLFYHICLMS